MTNYIIKYSFEQLQNLLIGKEVNFKSDCQFFPNFNVTGKVEQIKYASNGELIIIVKIKNKSITIGSNMHNLSFSIVQNS